MVDVQTSIATIVGARPQFIKMAAVSRALRPVLAEAVIHTGQHYDQNMSKVFFEELEIVEPDHNLGIGSGSHGEQTGRMLAEIEKILLQLRPALVLVYGDTNSTLAGALAAAKLHIPVAHVEAGLRSFNRMMPEELNRVLTDHASDILFAPTLAAVKNLRREGVAEERVQLVGDVMYDAALFYGARAEAKSNILKHLSISSKQYVLCTIHRAENTDDPARLAGIFHALERTAAQRPVILPLHPRTRKMLSSAGLLERLSPQLRLLEPVGYPDMVMLEKNACLIATDSGGVQKEAFFYRVPCVTLRDETEWVELVELGWNRVVSPNNPSAVELAIREGIHSSGAEANPYGRGDAAERIVKALQVRLQESQ
jgi:UDP-GlcNAc3NAcA epimerase